MLKRLSPCILFFFYALVGLSQDYTIDVQKISVEDGLLHRAVLAVVEDRNGFLWIGTPQGLQRYDGVEFKSWTRINSSKKLQNVAALWLDQEDWLWIWDNNQLEFYFLNTQTLEMLNEEQRFGKDFPLRTNSDRTRWGGGTFFEDADLEGKLFFILSQPTRIIVYEKGAQFTTVPIPEVPGKRLGLLGVDENGNFWIGEDYQKKLMYVVSPTGKLLTKLDYSEKGDYMAVNPLGPEQIEISYRVGERYYQDILDLNALDKPPVVSSSDTEFDLVSRSPHGLNWARGVDGWKIFDRSNQNLLGHIRPETYDPGLFGMTLGVYQDRRNHAWIYGQWGLFRVIVKPTHFNRLLQIEKGQKINPSTRAIVLTDDSIFVNLEFSGLAAIPKNAPKNWSLLYERPHALFYDGRPLIRAHNGDFFSGFPGELQVLGPNGKLKKRIPVPGQISPVWALYEDRKHRIWVGSGTGIGVMRAGEDTIEAIENVPQGEKPLVPQVYHFSEPREDEIWICSSLGLAIYDASEGKALGTYRESKEEPFYLPISTCFFHHEDRDGIHWIGCDDGLVRWDKEAGTYRRFTTADGLPNNVIYSIFEDEAGMLWLSSDYGIIRFDRTTFQLEAFLPQHGISHQEFNRISAAKDADGTIYFGGLKGITSFHPKDFNTSQGEQAYQLHITDLQFMGGESDSLVDRTSEVVLKKSIVFEPDDRFFRIRFASPILDDASKTLYGWRIEGLDENWNYQKENVIQISTLPYGEYTLAIKGQDNSRRWTNPLRIKIVAPAPFYLQTWFILVAILLLLLITWELFKMRTRRFQQRQKELEEEVQKATSKIEEDKQTIATQADELKELDRVKSRFFANVSHELRTPLSLILGPVGSVIKSGELGERNLRFLQNAQKNGKDLLKLVGSLLDLSKMESGKMELQEQKVHLFSFARTTVSTFESYAQQAGIDLIFECKTDKNLSVLVDRSKLETVLNNLLSNAVKYTPKGGQIKVLLEDKGARLSIQVEDSGRGIHPDDLPRIFDRFYQSRQEGALTEGGTGIGLALGRELVKIMGGEIGAESVIGQGSRFWVELPRKEVLGVQEQEEIQEEDQQADFKPIVSNEKAFQPGQKTIMIVEDNHSLRDYLSMILGTLYNLHTCENGKVALDMLKALPTETMPDLILSDIMMPVMDGYQLLQQLKSQDQYRKIPVIMLTARAAIEDKLTALRIGVDDYLIKPFEEDELLARIENLLRHAEVRTSLPEAIPEEPGTVNPASSQEDQIWLENLESYIVENLESDLLSVAQLANEFAMSQSTLQRQLKKLVGLSPIKYIQEHRLSTARELLENRRYNTVAQVAYKVGFKDPKAFTRSFRQRFGKTPSEFFQIQA